MKIFPIGNQLTSSLLAACVVLAGLLALESHNMVQTKDDTPPDARSAVDSIAQKNFTAPGIAAFSEITERPLFIAGREPPPEPEAAPVAAPRPSPLRLHLEGVAITPEASIAVVRDPATNKMLRLGKGMKYQGWEVTSVTATGVTFEQGEQSQELTLKKDENTREAR